MKYYYKIQGLTCNGCVNSVKVKLEETLPNQNINVLLKESKVIIEGDTTPDIEILKSVLPEKYTISEFSKNNSQSHLLKSATKLSELKPLILIFGYVSLGSILMHIKSWDMVQFMIDFMGLFFIVFSFFKLLDLKGFTNTFKMYDPLAKKSALYAKVYPFIEVMLGLLFLFRFEVKLAIVITLFILTITTIGVTKTLRSKEEIQCACLGSVLKLKMTEATFIENTIMILMGVSLLLNL